jgi:ornithine cyclodeaminase/alanine dehydrogenase-like protein (mu-crystallin family)
MLILSASDVARAVTDAEVLAAVGGCFRETASGRVLVPARIKSVLDDRSNRIIVMPAYLRDSGVLATKIVTVFPGNDARGLPLVNGAVLLSDPETGLPSTLIEGASITDARTAAASAVATRALAVRSPRVLALIGAGSQGRAHLRFLSALYIFDEVRVCARRLENARRFADQASSYYAGEVRAFEAPEECVRGAGIVVTATTSRTPVLEGAWLAPGAHVCGVGSATPSHRELDSEVLERASIVAVDDRAAALAEAGDLLIPIAEGRLAAERVVEVGDIMLGRSAGRTSEDDITLYKGAGTAALDAAVAALIDRRARELGLGSEVSFTG